ncbi:MAG: hypothetical protein A9Z00_11710 [Thermobacillus sp. ZCTH02-B1]|nr:MAG: hypothetical protein A9Z00_11710 [Thermobacillus sp. ZCTH02-B1]
MQNRKPGWVEADEETIMESMDRIRQVLAKSGGLLPACRRKRSMIDVFVLRDGTDGFGEGKDYADPQISTDGAPGSEPAAALLPQSDRCADVAPSAK